MGKGVIVLSVGGSLINSGTIDIVFLKKLKKLIMSRPEKFILVCGGGKPAREYMSAAKEFGVSRYGQDEIGIAATWLNGELVRQIFNAPELIKKPTKKVFKKVLMVGCYKPGHSSDFDTVRWGALYNAKIFNLSNTDYVYTADPKKNPSAKPIKKLSWKEYKKMIPAEWSSGLSTPFDPVATRFAEKHKLKVFLVNGKRLDELENAFDNKLFIGTVIE